MFRVSFFCDDKKLASVLHSLMGLAAGVPEVQPVANAVHKNGKVQAASGSLDESFAIFAKQNHLTKFAATDVTEFCKIAGMAPASRGYILKRLVKSGSIKQTGTGAGTTYTVAK